MTSALFGEDLIATRKHLLEAACTASNLSTQLRFSSGYLSKQDYYYSRHEIAHLQHDWARTANRLRLVANLPTGHDDAPTSFTNQLKVLCMRYMPNRHIVAPFKPVVLLYGITTQIVNFRDWPPALHRMEYLLHDDEGRGIDHIVSDHAASVIDSHRRLNPPHIPLYRNLFNHS